MDPSPGSVVRRRKVSTAVFTPILPGARDRAEAAAAQVLARIEDGHFERGARLPSERDLAQGLGVSRTVVRECLRSLESMGYVRSSLGRGTFVIDPTERWHSERVIEEWLRSHQAAFRDLVELRAALESQSIRGSTGDTRRLARSLRPLIAAQAAAIAAGKHDEAAEIDQTFHLRIAADSPNEPLRDMCRALIMRSRPTAQAVYRVSDYHDGSVRQHRAIVAALGRGDRDTAAALIAEHHLSRSDEVASFLERRLTEA